MARFRRRRLSKGEQATSAAVSLATGAAVGVAAWYVTRLLLSRDELPDAPLLPEPPSDSDG
ncbi:MAG: hypothetical protein OSA81_07000 [Longimicrobiales bacterium]|nr:hypothetical protein [Longimicrobiales bacterium]